MVAMMRTDLQCTTRCMEPWLRLRRHGMAENGIPWRRDAEKALEDAKQDGKRALVDFTAAPM